MNFNSLTFEVKEMQQKVKNTFPESAPILSNYEKKILCKKKLDFHSLIFI